MGLGARTMQELIVATMVGLEGASSTNLSGSPISIIPPTPNHRVLVLGGIVTGSSLGASTITFASTGRTSLVVSLPQNSLTARLPESVYRGAAGQAVTITGSSTANAGAFTYCFID
jgi:hypothetical protein